MPGPDPLSLEERVARLERLVARLLEQSDEPKGERAREHADEPGTDPGRDREPWSWARPSDAEPHRAGAPVSEGGAAAAPPEPEGIAGHGERWLGRVGVIFVILAFGFLFKYAFDQGWIGPAFRLVLGFAAATVMLVVGLRLEGSRERYSQYLLGGAIAVYYLVGYASYELYELVPFALAFAFMCGVTVVAFVLAERQRLASLAVIGAAGGLATPFLVSNDSQDVLALALYTTLLLAGAGAIQFLRGWRLLLFVLGFGGLAVMGLAVGMIPATAGALEYLLVTIGILAAWAVFGVGPLFRAHMHELDPEAWPEPVPPRWWRQVTTPKALLASMLRVACVSAALIATVELGALYGAEIETLGVLFVGAALLYAALAYLLSATRPALDVAAEVASISLAIGIALVLNDYRVMLPLAVLAAGMHMAHDRWKLGGVSALAHLVFGVLAILLVAHQDLAERARVSPFGVLELAALAAIVLAVSSSFAMQRETAKRVYWIGAHVAFMIWLVTQFTPMEYGQELISLSWGIYGIILLLAALRIHMKGMQLAGLITLGVVAAKLLLVDMAQVGVIWRILLFMGFGAAFLGLSYLINREAESA